MDNTTVAIGFLFITTITINTYLGPCLAIAHSLVPPSMRAVTSAILFLVLNLIGLGLGPLSAGLLSDFYAGFLGDQSLRWAMLTIGFFGLPGIALFILAARRLPGDLARRAAVEA
jgi:MFS family permease